MDGWVSFKAILSCTYQVELAKVAIVGIRGWYGLCSAVVGGSSAVSPSRSQISLPDLMRVVGCSLTREWRGRSRSK